MLILTMNLYSQEIVAVKGSKAAIKQSVLKLKKGKKYSFATTSGNNIIFIVYKIKNKKAYVNILDGKAVKGSSLKDSSSLTIKPSYLRSFKHEVLINPIGAVFRAFNFNYNYFISKNYSVGPELSLILGSYENVQSIPTLIADVVPATIKIEEKTSLGGFAIGARGNYYLSNSSRGFFIPHGLSYVSGKANPFASITVSIPSLTPPDTVFPNIKIPEISLSGASAYAGFGYVYAFKSFIFKAAGGLRYNLLTKEVEIKLGDIPGSETQIPDPNIRAQVLKYDTSGASGVFPYGEISFGYRF